MVNTTINIPKNNHIPIEICMKINSYLKTCHLCNRYCVKNKCYKFYCDDKCYFISKKSKIFIFFGVLSINILIFIHFTTFVNLYKIISFLALIISVEDLF